MLIGSVFYKGIPPSVLTDCHLPLGKGGFWCRTNQSPPCLKGDGGDSRQGDSFHRISPSNPNLPNTPFQNLINCPKAGRQGTYPKGCRSPYGLLADPYISPIYFCGQGITNPVFIGIYGNIIRTTRRSRNQRFRRLSEPCYICLRFAPATYRLLYGNKFP